MTNSKTLKDDFARYAQSGEISKYRSLDLHQRTNVDKMIAKVEASLGADFDEAVYWMRAVMREIDKCPQRGARACYGTKGN